MVERETLRISTDAPWNETPRLLKEEILDVALKTTPKGICILEFTDDLPEELREIFEGLDLTVHSVSGREPTVIQLFVKNISENDVLCIIDGWAEKEGINLQHVVLSENNQE